jgi:hypothetical protein
MTTILSLFEDKLVDDRQPWIDGIRFPGIEGSFSVYAPKAEPWIQLIAVRIHSKRVSRFHPYVHPFIHPSIDTNYCLLS